MNQHPLILHFEPMAPMYLSADGDNVTQADFVTQARMLAEQWPFASEVINLCDDRHKFMLGCAAAALRGVTTVLPSSHGADHLLDLRRRHPDASVIEDVPLPAAGTRQADMPWLDYDKAVFIMFTSGSTGAPEPHRKTWSDFLATMIGSTTALGLDDRQHHMVATVPTQHAYGMETAGVMPLFGRMAAHVVRPFFPADIIDALQRLPAPRVLVTTPPHLRALAGSGLVPPKLDAVVSSTAPLSPELAEQAEAALHAPIHEIYGCSEVGSFATRQTARDKVWTLYAGYDMRQDGYGTSVRSPSMSDYFQLSDRIERVGERGFLLHGRSGDLIKVGGKRCSLTELTLTLQRLPGVEDAVVFLSSEEAERPSALVVAPGCTEAGLRHELSRHIDDVFIPRPLRIVDSLPRNELGKLPRAGLIAALNRIRQAPHGSLSRKP